MHLLVELRIVERHGTGVKTQIKNFMKIHAVAANLLQAERHNEQSPLAILRTRVIGAFVLKTIHNT